MAREQGPKGLKTRGEILEGELATLHVSSTKQCFPEGPVTLPPSPALSRTRMGELSLV